MIKTKPKNSALNKNKIPDALQKAKIRKELNGLDFVKVVQKDYLKSRQL